MYGTKYSNTIHPELQLVLLLACPLLPQGRELYAGFYPSVGAFCFDTIWTAASPSSWWRNQATWQHFVSETRRQHFLWIWKKSTDLPRFCRVVIDIKHQNSFSIFVSDILVCKFRCPDQSESSFETISEFQSSVSSKEAFCNKEPLYLPCSRLMNMKCKAQGIHDTGHFQRVASECPTSHFDKLASQGSLLRFWVAWTVCSGIEDNKHVDPRFAEKRIRSGLSWHGSVYSACPENGGRHSWLILSGRRPRVFW